MFQEHSSEQKSEIKKKTTKRKTDNILRYPKEMIYSHP